MKNKFLPICKKDMDERGIQQLDFVYVSAMPMLTIHPLDMPSSAGTGSTWIYRWDHFTAGLER